MDGKREATDGWRSEAEGALEALVEGIESGRGAAAAAVARRRSLRMARLAAAGVRLEDELGSDDAQVGELRDRIVLEDRVRVALDVRSERERRRPRPGPGEWMAYGRVVNAGGAPVQGARVRLFDLDRKFDDLLGETRTDEFGDWVIGPYHARDFFEKGEGAPELYVKVYGARGKLVYSGEEEARFEAGQVEYFEIVLDDRPDGGGGGGGGPR
jgi:hypothetical protein